MHHQRMCASSLAVIPQTLSLPPATRFKKGEDRRKKKREVLHLLRCYTHTPHHPPSFTQHLSPHHLTPTSLSHTIFHTPLVRHDLSPHHLSPTSLSHTIFRSTLRGSRGTWRHPPSLRVAPGRLRVRRGTW